MQTKYKFIGKEGKYQIPKGAIVRLIKCHAKRKCTIEYDNKKYISSVALLRKYVDAKPAIPNLLKGLPFNIKFF